MEQRKVIQLTPSQTTTVLIQAIEAKEQIILVGAPGLCKTALWEQAAVATGHKLLKSFAVMDEPPDVKGFCFPSVDRSHAEFLPAGVMYEIMTTKQPTICLLDDLGQAMPAVQAAWMQPLHGREINGRRISKHVVFGAATNRREDRAGVSGILEPIKSRFTTIIHVKPSERDWRIWALKSGVPTDLVAFLAFRPSFIENGYKPTLDMTNSACPRTLEGVGRIMNKFKLDAETEFAVYAGAAGIDFSTEFTAFLRMARTIARPEYIIMHPDDAPVPEEPSGLYAVATALSNCMSTSNASKIIRYANRMPKEFQALLVYTGTKKNADLEECRAIIEWHSKNHDLI